MHSKGDRPMRGQVTNQSGWADAQANTESGVSSQATSRPNSGNAKSASSRIPQAFIDTLQERADILSVVSASVQLKKSGANYLGLCPFHSEKSASFTVAPTKGFYHCFGCGASGFALDFLMEHHGLSFREAVKDLAQSTGLALPAELMPNQGQDRSDQADYVDAASLHAVNERVASAYQQALSHNDTGLLAKHYLKNERRIDRATLLKYRIGYAPAQWRPLEAAFDDYANNPFLPLAGLVREKVNHQGRANRYDWFRNRIMFPVRDVRGRVVAFGGRILPDPVAAAAASPAEARPGSGAEGEKSDPKYMNSPDTPVFIKSHVLYGLFEARQAIREKKSAIVVEGYMDVVMLSQAGFDNAVAGMGTAFTRQQFERLALLCERITFAFDADAAGQAAAWRVLNTILPQVEDRLDIRFCLLNEDVHGGKDPDEIIRTFGAERFARALDDAHNLSEFLIRQLRGKYNDLRTAEDRARFAAEATNLTGRLPYQGHLRKLLRAQIAAESQIPGSALASIAASARQSRPVTFWQSLHNSILAAPECAAAIATDLLEILDEDQPDEAQVMQALRHTLSSSGAENSWQSPNTAPSIEPGSPQWMQARDLLSAATDTIIALRQDELLQALKDSRDRGEIDELTYMRECMSIRQTDPSN